MYYCRVVREGADEADYEVDGVVGRQHREYDVAGA